MTLANRTALVAGAAGLLAVTLATLLSSVLFARSVSQRVDDQLEQRAQAAPLLATVGDRLAISELTFVVSGARVLADGEMTNLGRIPATELPPLEEPGFRTVRADGESWRLLAVEVRDVPDDGDEALVEFVEPLGNVNAQLRTLRRRIFTFGGVAAALVSVLGLVAARQAARPLTLLTDQVRRLGNTPPQDWQVEVDSTTPEVAEITGALNQSLGELAVASRRREEALAASRRFASAASHELRTPLQSAMINLDLALGNPALRGTDPDSPLGAQVETARTDLDRMRSALDAVRRLSEVDLIDADAFEVADVAEIVDQAVGTLAPEAAGVTIEQAGPDHVMARVWVDGVRLAVENLLRNALRHGAPTDGSPPRIVVTVTPEGSILVDDNGPGVPVEQRERIVQPFQRGSTTAPGSGLGLAFVDRVAVIHGGRLAIVDSPDGGARLVLALGPPA